jgi:Na+/proline symporter
VQAQFDAIAKQKQEIIPELVKLMDEKNGAAINIKSLELKKLQKNSDSLRGKVKDWISSKEIKGDPKDTDYIFLNFVINYLPVGLVGLLVAIIFLASWGSIAAAINSLASCTMVDFHRRFRKQNENPEKEYNLSRWYTFAWGVFSIIIAMFTHSLGNSLIEAVNILGSLFYGVILGVFLVAFFLKRIKNSNAVFWGAVLAEILVLTVFYLTKTNPPVIKMGFLWLNPIGALGTIIFTLLMNLFLPQKVNPAVQAGF